VTAIDLGGLSGNISVSGGSSDAPDPDLSNNSLVFTTTVNPAYDLVLSSENDLTSVDTGISNDFYFTILNSGPSDSGAFSVELALPDSSSWSVFSDRGTCDTSGDLVSCSIDNLNNGESINLAVQSSAFSYGSVDISLKSSWDTSSISDELNLSVSENSAAISRQFSFDIDQSGSLAALTDGLLVMRHLFDFSGDTLVANAMDTSAIRNSASDISSYLTDAQTELDIDGSGDVQALTDGLLLIRYLFDFRGDSLIKNAIGTSATRTSSAEIEAYIAARIPSD
jgi:hypothetical protein